MGQTFSDKTNYKTADTYCLKLKPEGVTNSLDIDDQWKRLEEEEIDRVTNREIFRVIIMSSLGDVESIQINKIERIDSLCKVTTKFVKNLRRNEILVHTKTYDISMWNKFKTLADTTFWNQSETISINGSIHDGQIKVYEFNSMGQYRKLIRGSNTRDTDERLTSAYLGYLIGPFDDVKCKTAIR